MKLLMVALMAIAAAGTPAARTFTGTITDSMCEKADHSGMKMGPTDAECARACNEEHDAAFVLYDGKTVYALTEQHAPAAFAGRKVTVTGTLDPKTHTIHVASIEAANP
jgi:type 1 fimbria pilin